jgi:TPR repeat protein
MASRFAERNFQVDNRLVDAAHGDVDAYYDLGMAYSLGYAGTVVDMVQAHKWFNLAAMAGVDRGQERRAEIAGEMSAREIAEAQRQARAWLALTTRAAA